MSLHVTRLKPRQGTYEVAVSAFRSGDFLSCTEALADLSGAEAAILRARALIRMGNLPASLESLDAQNPEDFSHETAAEALSVKAYALHIMQRPAEASSIAVEARARCFSSGLVEIEGELLLAGAIGALTVGDYDRADAIASSVLALEDNGPSWVKPSSYFYSLGYWRVRACDLRSVVESLRTNYKGQAYWLRRAFDEYDGCGISDTYTLVGLLANYADVAITLGLANVAHFIIERAEQIDWSPSLVSYEFRVFSALAEAASSAGDQISALRYFRRCRDCAPNAALQIRASLERARVLREIGELFSAREEIDHAMRLSKSLNWEDADALSQRQLLLLAGQVANFDATQSAVLLTRFDGLARVTSNGLAIKDERFRGEEFMVRASVARANGQDDRAITMLLDALQIFSGANLAGKAAYAAADLAELTGEPRYIGIARDHSEQQPGSILARKMSRFDKTVPVGEVAFVAAPAKSTVVAFARPKLALLS